MPLTRYDFTQAVSAFFEMPTEFARPFLPGSLQALELHHGSSILALTAFDFTKSMVGPYQEVVLAIIVPPLVQSGGEFPKSAFYPFLLGTSTEESRQHAIERWHLPHYMADVGVDFAESDGVINVSVSEGDKPILDYSVTEHQWEEVDHLYQSFMVDDSGRYKVDIHMRGQFCEHEEERGSIEFHDHPMCANLDPAEVATFPFRELWMKQGHQLFEELETL